ncbi:hypothetical protein FE257_009505 [Aspergillus nanangensis]|uniref:Zn(2)-C6 fungal-type domain-containing protein n=1 Tax=Aspergillus nanangensis TaxID=2582783 RepID=A0AAD4GSR0_ASPNN|nr:hypothetical protein FE257_009505 [Aspergillus nanangensis]
MSPPGATVQPVAIAPALETTPSVTAASTTVVPYTCQACVNRKVKCDRILPSCSSCIKGKLECMYQPPPPRTRKRKRENDENMHDRLIRYERILRENDLLSTVDMTPEPTREPSPPPSALGVGKLVAKDGKSRYIDSALWLDAGEAGLGEMCENGDDGQPALSGPGPRTEDPIIDSMAGTPQPLTNYHPSYADAMKLWTAHIQNVEPLCKILHIPSTTKVVETAAKSPSTISKAHECLLFSVYHFAVFSMREDDCLREFGQSRNVLMEQYHYAFQKSLVNASWLRTTEIPVLQAYVLFLIAMRTQVDPHTFWIWTGIAIRIAQRMGLHRDGENLNLSPFDVQIRRRLWWQLLPLDGFAGQISGTGISITPSSWDTKQPLNLNDDQIYIGMKHQPREQTGASEMIYCLTKTELSNFYTRVGMKVKDSGALQFRDRMDLERRIDEVESSIEAKYLRYCDIANPLHLLTLGIVRSAANAVRLRGRLPRPTDHTISDKERRDLCALAMKILDTNCALYSYKSLLNFQWQIKSSFLWEALICILNSLAKAGFYSPTELISTWNRISDVYSNHPEIFDSKKALQVLVGKVTLKAWAANPPRDLAYEPAFITALRSQHETDIIKHVGGLGGPENGYKSMAMDSPVPLDSLVEDLDGIMNMNLDSNFVLGMVDWSLWDP